MGNWFLLTLVGKDSPGIVARVTTALAKAECNLGDSSMARLGSKFCIMLLVQYPGSAKALEKIVAPVAQALSLRQHLEPLEDEIPPVAEPDVRISVYCSDRTGIMEEVTGTLARAGLNILNLDSNIGESHKTPTYFIHIEGIASKGLAPLYDALETLTKQKDMQGQLVPINSSLG